MPATNSSASSAQTRFPRWLAVITWILGLSGFHVVLPWAISLSGAHHGWTRGRPSPLNLSGLLLLAFGAAVIASALAQHFVHGREGVEVAITPSYLIRRGPYQYTRNPMYVAALSLWLGWSLFYGSILVLLAVLVIAVMLEFIVVPFEERRLTAQFGNSYLEYVAKVPRWVVK
jgi:protein-S-isoprenylcysteine O-methyltransferase Ste14